MKLLSWGVFFVGGCLVISSLIVSKTINFKDEHVIPLTNGAVKLGDVYREINVVSVQFTFDDPKMEEPVMLTSDVPVTTYKDTVKEMLQKIVDAANRNATEKEKIKLETMQIKKSATLKMSTSIIYQAEHNPNFTLHLRDKTVSMPVNTALYSSITDNVDTLIKDQQKDYDAASFLNK